MTKKGPRLNVYKCPNGHETVTVDVAHGVTPFLIGCQHVGCQELARSSFYPYGVLSMPEFEWYKPETAKGMGAFEKAHWQKGGLSLRLRTGCSVVMHGDKPAEEEENP